MTFHFERQKFKVRFKKQQSQVKKKKKKKEQNEPRLRVLFPLKEE
jgi:hypothetical protein